MSRHFGDRTLGYSTSVSNNGTLLFDRTGSLTVSAQISGSGQLVQSGQGTTVLWEDMTYSGGTTINAGTLQVGGNSTVGSIIGPVLDDGTLAISRSDDVDFANVVTGIGGVAHAGSGTLRLTGASSYTGNTSVNGGGILLLDSAGSSVPVDSGVTLTNGTLNFSDTNLTVWTLRKLPSGTGTILADAGKTLTVEGGGDVVANQGVLNLVGVPKFVFNDPFGSFSALPTVSGADTASAYLSDDTTITAASFTVGKSTLNGGGTSASALVELGQATAIHADTIVVGDNGTQSGSSTLQIAPSLSGATVAIRGADGTSPAKMTVGSKHTSDYSGGTGTVDLTVAGSTLDALLDTLVIGRHTGGAGNFDDATSGSFAFNLGTLDATSITLGVGLAPNIKTASGTLTTNGGTIRTSTLTLVQDSGGAMGTATVNLNAGGILEATSITGQAAANAVINWNEGSLKPVSGTTLTVAATTLRLPADTASRTLATGSDTAVFSPGVVFKPSLDSSAATPAMGGFTVTGNLTITDVTLSPVDLAATSQAIAHNTVFTLINYSGATLAGTFSGLAEGATVVIGANTFVLSYVGNGGTAVTLTADNPTTPYQAWATANGIGGESFYDDFDGDGIDNGLEWILGGSPATSDGSILVTTTATASGGLTLAFNREEATIGQTTLQVEYDTDLVAPWTGVTIGATSSGPDANGVTVTIDDSATPDKVTVNIPAANAAAGKLFARLKATMP